MAPGESEFDTPAVGEGEGEGKGSGILPRGRKHAGTFLLRVFKGWGLGGSLGENLTRIFISFMLTSQNEI